MGKRSKFRVSTIVAVAAGVVTIIVSGAGLWAQFAKPAAELRATVQYGTYRLDPWTGADIKKLDEVLKALNSYRIQGGKLSPPLEKFANDSFKVQFPSFPSNRVYGYARTAITDLGDLEAKNIELRIPYAVGSLIILDNGSQQAASGSPTIDLGDLRPGQEIVVYSWFLSKPVFLPSGGDVGLTYDGGLGRVNIEGRHGLAYSLFSSTFMQIWLAVICFWLVVFIWSTAYRLGWNAAKGKLSSQTAENGDADTDQSPVTTDN